MNDNVGGYLREQRPRYYTLDDEKNPVPISDVMEWAKVLEDLALRRVAFTDLTGGLTVSTVFLGLDHSFSDEGPPILFETMVFDEQGREFDHIQKRYATWGEAEAGHNGTILELRRRLRA